MSRDRDALLGINPTENSGESAGVQKGRPSSPKFLHFHAALEKSWSNSRLAHLWEILDPLLEGLSTYCRNILVFLILTQFNSWFIKFYLSNPVFHVSVRLSDRSKVTQNKINFVKCSAN